MYRRHILHKRIIIYFFKRGTKGYFLKILISRKTQWRTSTGFFKISSKSGRVVHPIIYRIHHGWYFIKNPPSERLSLTLLRQYTYMMVNRRWVQIWCDIRLYFSGFHCIQHELQYIYLSYFWYSMDYNVSWGRRVSHESVCIGG